MYTKGKNASMNTNIKNQCKIKPIVYDHWDSDMDFEEDE